MNTRVHVAVAAVAAVLLVLWLGPSGPSWLGDFLNSHNVAITALATAVIAIFTVVLAWATTIQAVATRKALDIAGKTAEAALLQAKAAIGIELPIIRVEPFELQALHEPLPEHGPYAFSGECDFGPTRYTAVGPFQFRNFGRTPAAPIKFVVGWSVARQLPEVPVYSNEGMLNHAAQIVPDSEVLYTAGDFRLGIELTEDQIRECTDGTSWLWVFGALSYLDFLSVHNEARFCLRYSRHDEDVIFYFASDGSPPNSYITAIRHEQT